MWVDRILHGVVILLTPVQTNPGPSASANTIRACTFLKAKEKIKKLKY
jgi:hypothetical protein